MRLNGCSFMTFIPCILKKLSRLFKKKSLIHFENKLSYSECIVRGAQKGWITREFVEGPQLKGALRIKYNSSIKTLPECRIFAVPWTSNFKIFPGGVCPYTPSQRTNQYKIKHEAFKNKFFPRAPNVKIGISKTNSIKVLILLAMIALYKVFLGSRPGPGTDL